MIFSRAWFALMRRNFVYRRRNWIGTLLEIALPVGFIAILVGIKSAVEGTEGFKAKVVDPVYPTDADVFTPLTFKDYVTALQAKRTCEWQEPDAEGAGGGYFDITGMPMRTYNWQIPMIKCDPRSCQEHGEDARPYCEFAIVALAGTDAGGKERAQRMKEYIEDRYPVLRNKEALRITFDILQLFDGPTEMDEYVKRQDYGTDDAPKLAMGIVFEGNDMRNYKYSLRQNSTNYNDLTAEVMPTQRTTPDTAVSFKSFAKNDEDACGATDDQAVAPQGPYESSCTGQYLYNGVLTFQRLVGDFILNATGAAAQGYKVSEAGVKYVPFPTRRYEEEGFYAATAALAPLLLLLGLLYPVAAMIGYIVGEKELRQKELMKMMSVTESDIGWAWFMSFFLFNIITATLTAMVSNSLYENSDNFLMWIFWLFTFIAVIVFIMAISSFSSKTTRAIMIGLLIFFVGYFLAVATDYKTLNGGIIGLISLHPIAAFSYGLQEIGRLEDAGIGITSDSIDLSETESGYNFRTTINTLVADCIFWGVVSWYLNRVVRPDYGQALPPWFPFTYSYWCPGRSGKVASKETWNADEAVMSGPLEPVGEALMRQSAEGKNIEIRNLCKTFGKKIAVDDLSLTMYSGQITALLGHNGAGKTTTISMLTGAMAPTSGHATIAGKDIRTQMPEIRQDIGICLQHDCLFPMLTVREHIQFFSRLKGLYSKVSHQEAEEHVDQAIRDVALFEKRNTLSKNLSGGMKRKLSVAMAFCGGSKVVLLDEPTSGMDPFSRRFTWNVIRQNRRDRCIILTTHFMDEADILGDRIAIMAEGQLRCAGSSLFLKKTYGVGYQLTIEKLKSKKSSSDNLAKLVSNDEKLMDIVQASVPEATLLSNVGSELSYQLPMGAASQFGPMFEALDCEVDEGNVSSYGVSITTLDEVFLLVARGDTNEKKEFASSKRGSSALVLADDTSKSSRSKMDLEKERLFFRHLGALFKKRAAFFRRDKKAWVITSILPSLFVLFGFVLSKVVIPKRELDPVVLSLDDYNVGITSPRNPINFNSAGNPFTCQPGVCAYGIATMNTTDESYYFCGEQARVEGSCSIQESSLIIDRITDAGAVGIGQTVRNVSEASERLLEMSNAYSATQFGAIFFTHDRISTVGSDIYDDLVVNKCLANAIDANYTTTEECDKFGGIGYVIQYNFTALHISPLYQVLADQALVREALKDSGYTIQCTIDPLPITKFEDSYGKTIDVFYVWVLIVLSFPFIGGAFASFVVAERESKAKHLQTVAGVEPAAYWLSTFLWDVLNYQIPLWITVMFLYAFDADAVTRSDGNVFTGALLILILYGPASAAFAYCVSFAFKSPSMCNVVLIVSGFLIGMGGTITMNVLQGFGYNPSDPRENFLDIANIITWLLRWVPSFCLGKGLFQAAAIDVYRLWEEDQEMTIWSDSLLKYDIMCLILQTIGYLLLAMLLDKWSTNPSVMAVWQKFVQIISCRCAPSRNTIDITTALPDDSDVIEEQNRVQAGDANDDLIVMSQLTKIYDNGKIAVNNLSLGIPAGECFGLLGINGAGKTTTMGMLTAEFPPTTGDATLAGFSVSREPQKTRRRIGYCPQFDAHFANLTGREHVELYASIKGIPREFVKEAAAAKLKEVGLSEKDSDRLSVGYSGGMKRRLSLACATIGQPQIVFLDECSTGVDPVARREIWQLISDMVAGRNVPDEEKTSVILTTHSMEECEALCPRIGIMANGRLRCLGSAQHLKNKFGQGFQVEMKVQVIDREDEDYVDNAAKLAATKQASVDHAEDVLFNIEQARCALKGLTGDSFLADMVSEENPVGYSIWKEAISDVGVPLDALAVFATSELRMRNVDDFMKRLYPNHILRERQDTKARYEVNSAGIRISNIFASIEREKDQLRLSDYGVSQTSLEQVFNMHAAEAERLKQGRNDG